MNERVNKSVESSEDPVDFSAVKRDDLRPLAQDLIASGNIDELEKLRNYVKECVSKLPYNTMYSSEWDYWNYTYLISEINAGLSSQGEASS